MELLRGIALVLATMTTGMMAGVFAQYSHTVMRALGRTDDRTFVAAFQNIDRAIINPWFLLTYIGALVFTGAAAALHLGGDARATLPWILVALALYVVIFVITAAVNVPRNNEIKAAGDPDRIDVAAARARFDEARWTRWNHVRTVTSTIGFASLCVALVVYGGTV